MASKAGRIVALTLVLTVASALVVLAYLTAPPGQSDRLRVASVLVQAPPAGGDSGGITGRLGASRSGDRACFWLDDSNLRTERLYLLFALKYSSSRALALLDQQGRPIAEPGQTVTAINAAPRPGAAPDFCPHGTGVTVYEVTRPG